jgi:hypothetical protein
VHGELGAWRRGGPRTPIAILITVLGFYSTDHRAGVYCLLVKGQESSAQKAERERGTCSLQSAKTEVTRAIDKWE